jgi:hypothetical protein
MSAVGSRATVGVAEPGSPLRRSALRGVDATGAPRC